MSQMTAAAASIAVVIPCFRVSKWILGVIDGIGPEISKIYVVDDHCPERSGQLVRSQCPDSRVEVLFHEEQLGVGGATLSGYRRALEDGADIVVKVDGDGQMDPSLISRVVGPIVRGDADYAKGNRFFRLESLHGMPRLRLIGNSLLSFITKFSTGYWDIFDPTNGFTAVEARVLRELDLDKVSQSYFFESDMLFRLGTVRAVVVDVPMEARYGDLDSNLRLGLVGAEFLTKHLVNFTKRVFYSYYLRNFNIASLELILGTLLTGFGAIYGAQTWLSSLLGSSTASSGSVMLAALPVLIGVQLLLAFFSYDMQNVPRLPLHKRL